MKYQIVDINTDITIEELDYEPKTLKPGTYLVKKDTSVYDDAIKKINLLAEMEIQKGFEYDGVIYGLSDRDQLNYTASMTLVNAGLDNIIIVGSKGNEKYYSVTFTNEEAKKFLSSIFSHVASILNKYRDLKRKILSMPEEAVKDELNKIMEKKDAKKVG